MPAKPKKVRHYTEVDVTRREMFAGSLCHFAALISRFPGQGQISPV
jgi:hypothetical protein